LDKAGVLNVQAAKKLMPLVGHSRYKGAFGGRGGTKSHFFAELLILTCLTRKTRAACIREVQVTIRDSVRQLLVDKIQKFNLGGQFKVMDREILGPNGSLIVFRGMQSYNAENIKSLEDFDVAWVEEAQTLSSHSLKLLRPTIRKEGSELWFSWNPRHDTDAVDVFFRGGSKRRGMISVEVNHDDNPWFPEVLKVEMEDDYADDPEMAEHVWGGGYQIVTEGSYYARHILKSEQGGHVGHFPYIPELPVHTAWDIGVDDYTAVWFIQEDGLEARILHYYELSNGGLEDVVHDTFPELNPDTALVAAGLTELDRSEAWSYGTHYMPHDIMVREWGRGAKTRYQTAQEWGLKPIHKGVAVGPIERINAVRALFPQLRFNDTQSVRLGMKRLRRYHRKWNDSMQTYTTPEHDESSHGCDALGEFAVNCSIRPKPAVKTEPGRVLTAGPGSTATMNDLLKAAKRGKARYD
jgi:phage terminase large subunit